MLKSNPGMPKTRQKHPAPHPRKPAIVHQPRTYRDLRTGLNLIAQAIRPTLGPLPRLVAIENVTRTRAPELMDDGALIARRIIEVRPRGWDVGAMLIRNALWQMHTELGDGTTTMGVMFQALVNEGMRAVIQQGCNAMLLRAGLEKGLQAILTALRAEATALEGKENIARVACGMCQGDLPMAEMMGEIFDIVGPEGMIVVEKGNKWGLEREYIEGTYWELSGWFSRLFASNPTSQQMYFEDAALLISDLKLTDPLLLAPVLEKCVRGGIQHLTIVAAEVSDAVIGLLVKNNRAGTIQSMAVRTPRIQEFDRVAAMEDMAVLTGGRAFYSASDTNFAGFQLGDLGRARRAWATDSQFGIFGGKGEPRLVRTHLAQVRGQLERANQHEAFKKPELQKRVGRLLGGTAILRVGAMTDTETDARKETANRAVIGVRNALRWGVLPGGGAALISAQEVLRCLSAENEDEVVAFKVLSKALEEPMRAIANNAGFQPDVILEKVKNAPKGFGVDARNGQIVDMRQCGILDAAGVVQKALEIAVSGAVMVLTTDVIIHHAEPKESIEP